MMSNRYSRESSVTGGGSRNIPALRRGSQSFNAMSRDSDENLDLFSKTRRFSLPLSSSSDDSSSNVPAKLGRLSVGSIKLPKNGADDLLSSTDGGKHDYDWLLTPPGTPLGSESQPPMAAPKPTSLVRSASTAKTSRLSVSQSESNHSSRPTRSSSVTRPSISSTSQYSTYSSHRSSSILNTSSASVSSYIRPSSPINRSPSTARPSTPSRSTVSRPSTPSRTRPTTTGPSLDKSRPSQNSRPSTPTSRPQISSTSSIAGSRSSSRPSTPVRRSPVPSVSAASGSTPGRVLSNGRTPATGSRPSSPGPRARPPQQPIVPPDFPLETPPNLRTTLPDRPVSAGRSRPGAAATTKGSPDTKGSINMPRRNPSPIATRGRLTENPGKGRVSSNGQLAEGPESRRASNVSDVMARRTLRSSTAGSENTGLGRTLSKSSLDMAIRHMDIRNGKGGTRSLSNTTLFPQSIRSAASKIQAARGLSGSESINSNGSLHSGDMSENGSNISANAKSLENGNEASDGRYLAKLSQVDTYESSRYEALLLKEDAKNTNWLHSVDDKSDQGLLFDNGFELLPEPFGLL